MSWFMTIGNLSAHYIAAKATCTPLNVLGGTLGTVSPSQTTGAARERAHPIRMAARNVG